MAQPPQLSPEDAKEKILKILHNDGDIIPTYHYNSDRRNLRNAPMTDVIEVLENGEIKRIPEWSEDHQNWVCNVEGFDIEDEKLIVVTAIIEKDWQLKIITVKG
ncbi:MAG: DUF4258 domain-containing protein [Pyrinomonadaceae bacterium]|nr:DUF4258 domain-containing protein [Pyrinomonadaceae bacterium]